MIPGMGIDGDAHDPWMVEPLDAQVDHVRGEAGAPVILEYGDYECPYSRQAFHAIEQVEHQLDPPKASES